MKNNLKIMMLLLIFSAVTAAQDVSLTHRKVDEAAIRSAVYEFTISSLTADVKSYKQQAAQRMIDLYKLIYEELSKDDERKKTFRENGIKNSDDFMANSVKKSARRVASMPQVQIEELARRESSGPITLFGDNKAKIRGIDVVFEDNKWKVDATGAIKAGFLGTPDKSLSAKSRAKIKRF